MEYTTPPRIRIWNVSIFKLVSSLYFFYFFYISSQYFHGSLELLHIKARLSLSCHLFMFHLEFGLHPAALKTPMQLVYVLKFPIFFGCILIPWRRFDDFVSSLLVLKACYLLTSNSNHCFYDKTEPTITSLIGQHSQPTGISLGSFRPSLCGWKWSFFILTS